MMSADGSPARLLGYGDESLRRVNSDSLIYILAAVILPETSCPQVRAALQVFARPGQRFHWREERQSRRQRIARVLSETESQSVVLVGALVTAREQERVRRRLLGRLLWELDQREVTVLTLESRHHERNQYDLHAVGGFRNAGFLSRRLGVQHGLPVQEPLLWAADAVAGAVGDGRTGNPTCLRILGGMVEIVEVDTIG